MTGPVIGSNQIVIAIMIVVKAASIALPLSAPRSVMQICRKEW